MEDERYYLYHLRDPECSPGFGFDDYSGTTKRPRSRFRQHKNAAARGTHPNPHIQKMYDASGGRLQMWLMCEGTRDEILAREALVVSKPGHHANLQKGGGPLRGKPVRELLELANLGAGSTPKRRATTAVVPSHSDAGIALVAVGVLAVAGTLYFLYRRRKVSEAATEAATVPMLDSDLKPATSPAFRRFFDLTGQLCGYLGYVWPTFVEVVLDRSRR